MSSLNDDDDDDVFFALQGVYPPRRTEDKTEMAPRRRASTGAEPGRGGDRELGVYRVVFGKKSFLRP